MKYILAILFIISITSFEKVKITPLWVCAAFYKEAKVSVQVVSAQTKKEAKVKFDRYLLKIYPKYKIDKSCEVLGEHCEYLIIEITNKMIIR